MSRIVFCGGLRVLEDYTEHKDNVSAGFHPGIDKEETEEKTKHYKDNISAGFHPGIDEDCIATELQVSDNQYAKTSPIVFMCISIVLW